VGPLAANTAGHLERIDASPVPLVGAASAGGEKTRCDSSSHARDVGHEEVKAVAVEVAAGAVVLLGGAGSACRARIWASRSGTPASRALVMAACRRECGLMWRGIPAALAIR
jgi:hypothetical protein